MYYYPWFEKFSLYDSYPSTVATDRTFIAYEKI